MDFRAREFREGKFQEVEVHLPAEEALTIYVNGTYLATLAVTPENLKELAVGFLFTEAIIGNWNEIRSIELDSSNNCHVLISKDFSIDIARKKILTAGCGGGTTIPSGIKNLKKIPAKSILKPEEIVDFVSRAVKESRRESLRGIHHAACLTHGRDIVLFSDIGRHNALDKAIGYMLMNDLMVPLAVFATGRLSSEMVVKAIRAGSEFAISLSSPTTAAVQLAENYGITLIGYARGNSFKIYSNHKRISNI